MLIDTFISGWQDHLANWQTELTDGSGLFLLIDGSFIPNFYREVQTALTDALSAVLLFEMLPGCTDKTRSVSPFLVPYSSTSSSLRHILSKCSGWPMASAIETTESMMDLARRLSAWCVVKNDGQRFNFRFPDTRRVAAIFDALSPLQRGSLAGPAVRWSYIGRDGNWHSLPMAQTASAIADHPALDDQQFAEMLIDSEVDETIVLLQDRGPLPQQSHFTTYSIVLRALSAAASGELDENRRVDWCRYCLDKSIYVQESDVASMMLAWSAKIDRKRIFESEDS